MKQSEHITQVLEPEEGMMLTQADDSIELKDRVTSGRVYLGSKDSPENWKEITVAEAEEIERQKKELADDPSWPAQGAESDAESDGESSREYNEE